MTTNILTDKIVLYFIAALAGVAAIISLYFLSVLLDIDAQHRELDEKATQDISNIQNLTRLIVTNQHIILASQDEIRNITKNQDLIQTVINETRRDNGEFFKILDGMIQAEINETKKIEQVLNILNTGSTKTTTP